MKNHVFALALIFALPATAAPPMVQSPTSVTLPATTAAVSGASLKVGGLARVKAAGCCLLVKITDMQTAETSDRAPIWIAYYYSDSSGSFPVNNIYARSLERRFASADLEPA
jgi:hypothetical protein